MKLLVLLSCLFLSTQADIPSIGIDHTIIADTIDYLDTENVLSVEDAASILDYIDVTKDSNVKNRLSNKGIAIGLGGKELSSNCVDKTDCQAACERNFKSKTTENKCKTACNGGQEEGGNSPGQPACDCPMGGVTCLSVCSTDSGPVNPPKK